MSRLGGGFFGGVWSRLGGGGFLVLGGVFWFLLFEHKSSVLRQKHCIFSTFFLQNGQNFLRSRLRRSRFPLILFGPRARQKWPFREPVRLTHFKNLHDFCIYVCKIQSILTLWYVTKPGIFSLAPTALPKDCIRLYEGAHIVLEAEIRVFLFLLFVHKSSVSGAKILHFFRYFLLQMSKIFFARAEFRRSRSPYFLFGPRAQQKWPFREPVRLAHFKSLHDFRICTCKVQSILTDCYITKPETFSLEPTHIQLQLPLRARTHKTYTLIIRTHKLLA